MKFVYEYRTSDNVKHEGVVSAADRDQAYAQLKQQGIRPSRLVEAPGFLNKIFGKGKRWLALAVLALVVLAVSLVALRAQRAADDARQDLEELIELGNRVNPIARCQVYGDPALLAQGTATGWADVFTNEAERILARYARPGVAVAPPRQSARELQPAFVAALSQRVEYAEGDTDETRKLKCIVEGMKDEARRYFAAGGNLSGYLRRLARRQQSEVDYYEGSKKMLTESYKDKSRRRETIRLWSERNEKLRAMGISTIPMPSSDSLKEF